MQPMNLCITESKARNGVFGADSVRAVRLWFPAVRAGRFFARWKGGRAPPARPASVNPPGRSGPSRASPRRGPRKRPGRPGRAPGRGRPGSETPAPADRPGPPRR